MPDKILFLMKSPKFSGEEMMPGKFIKEANTKRLKSCFL